MLAHDRISRRGFARARRAGGLLAAGALTATAGLWATAPATHADPAPDAGVTEVTTPGPFTETVPDGVCDVQITIAGGAGGDAIGGQTQGAGAVITFSPISVTPGQVIEGHVGGAGSNGGTGGVNGGGEGSPTGGHRGAGGGGWTDVVVQGLNNDERLALAGGGGGSGGGHVPEQGHGGDAGVPDGAGIFPGEDGLEGYDGEDNPPPGGGQGGQANAGGAGGVHPADASLNGQPGSALQGGAGGDETSLDGGAGGGGGLFGGGGGASTILDGVGGAGGGGGSSFVDADAPFASGGQNDTGGGYVNLDWVMCEYDLAVTKSAPQGIFEAGVPVTYTVTVENLGPEPMTTGDTVTVTDAVAAGGTLTGVSSAGGSGNPVECTPEVGGEIAGGTIECWRPAGGGNRGLDVGEVLTLTYTQTYEGATTVDNTAGVNDRGNQENNEATASVDPAEPSLELVKSADPATITQAGQEVTYDFTVTNTGNIALSDIVINEGEFSGTGELGDVTCPATELAPDANMVCSAEYVATQADVDAGQVTNTATAAGTTPGGNDVESEEAPAEVTAEQRPALDLVKSADPATITQAGQEVTYDFAVTNTGNVTMSDISVSEGDFSGTGELGDVTCPAAPAELAPGQTKVCSADYVATQADVDAGQVTNTATASGTDPGGNPVASDEAAAKLPAEQSPELDLVKSADVDEIDRVGQVVTYTFRVTNTGNVTLNDVSVSEGSFSGAGSMSLVQCPGTTLAVGESFECTATYTVRAADLSSDELTNTATATAQGPNGQSVKSEDANASIHVQGPQQAALPAAGAPSGLWGYGALGLSLLGAGGLMLRSRFA